MPRSDHLARGWVKRHKIKVPQELSATLVLVGKRSQFVHRDIFISEAGGVSACWTFVLCIGWKKVALNLVVEMAIDCVLQEIPAQLPESGMYL